MEADEKGTTRRHTFFCTNRERHTSTSKVVEIDAKEIVVFGCKVQGWLITTEEQVIEKLIPLSESLHGDVMEHDPE
ncbi:MAG: hypothetical protein ACI8PG_005215 [Planctomycetota bacterium]|jgi:hypothetical protein